MNTGTLIFFAGCLLYMGYAAGAEPDDSSIQRCLCNAPPLKVTQLTVVGDSVEDNGNTYAFSEYLRNEAPLATEKMPLYSWLSAYIPSDLVRCFTHEATPGAPYYHKRFSNGLLAVDHYAQSFDLDIENSTQYRNLAHGGCSMITHWHYPLPGLDEIKEWLLHTTVVAQLQLITQDPAPGHRHNELFIIGGGNNDYRRYYTNTEEITDGLRKNVEDLYSHKVRTLLWGTLGDLSLTPCMQNDPNRDEVRATLIEHNQRITDIHLQISQHYPDLKLMLVDYFHLYSLLKAEAANMGMNVNTPCTNITFKGCFSGGVDVLKSEGKTMCEDADHHVFFDSLHFTGKFNRMTAAVVCHFMQLFNIEAECPVVPGFNASAVLSRYLRESVNPVVRQYHRNLFNHQCPGIGQRCRWGGRS